jgi:hypothetical protein
MRPRDIMHPRVIAGCPARMVECGCSAPGYADNRAASSELGRQFMRDDPWPIPSRPFELRLNESGVSLDPALAFVRPELKDLLDFWQSKRQGRAMPARADFDPLDLRTHLGHLMLVDVERAPLRFRYRLVGTKITAIIKRDVTGRYFEEIYTGRLLVDLSRAFSTVVETRAPLRIFSTTGHPRNDVYLYDCALLPLSADGESVTMILAEMRFTFERSARDDRERRDQDLI